MLKPASLENPSVVKAFRVLLVSACVALMVSGCQRAPNDEDQPSASSTVAAPLEEVVPADEVVPDDATIELVSWEEVQTIASSTGKVTVVDVWSTVCMPCIKELPGLVELQKELGDRVRCMAVDVDFDGRKSKPPVTYQEDVEAILKSIDANFPNYICTTPSDDVYAAAEIDSIPAVMVFGADGTLVKKFVDAGEGVGFGYHKDVIPFVKSLVNE